MVLKRKRPTPDPLASDPEDEDYDDRETRPHTSGKKSRSGHKVKKRQRYHGDDSDGSEELDDSEVSFIESDSEEEPEIGPSGRPVRRSVKQQTYEESSESDAPASDNDDDDDDEGQEGDVKRRVRSSNVVKLKIAPAMLGKVTRQRTGSVARSLRGGSVDPITGARRSGRLNRESSEPLVALTDSGKHEKLVEPGTASPEPQPKRTTGRKSLDVPQMSHISEEQDELEEGDEERVPSTAEEEKVIDVEMNEAEVALESVEAQEEEDYDDDDDDDEPVTRRKTTRSQMAVVQDSEDEGVQEVTQSSRSLSRLAKGKKRAEKDDDFVMEGSDQEEEEEDSVASSPHKDEESPQRRNQSQRKRTRSGHNSGSASESEQGLDPDEMAEELEELESDQRRSRRRRGRPDPEDRPLLRTRKSNVNYAIIRPDLLPQENDEEAVGTPSKRKGAGATAAWQRNLFSTFGPFGGIGASGPGFAGGAGDSDSSDDERAQRVPGVGGATGMTPTTAQPPGLLGVGPDPSALSGTPANLGKVKSRQALADADPLGVDPNVSFDQVGGLQDHINQLKEMVQLPLLYPEVFQRFKITPPRGVLFHGPPGTGKTLLARALAASCSTEGRKITFYMRKGADALSKWVGEAERQLRLLFEEARNTQPSIIFFDEIDGLAPVRSSKQEQIHASIVSTLLALMDGMDGRGQVIVIGATNRPDSIDPALRRPGRFDREFYFPLPNVEARKHIINIHTRGWEPGLSDDFKNQLADITKGYGGADLRALCTEAALNAVQRRYPQIYSAKEKLIIDPSTITVNARDFMISAKKMVPSSERSSASGASPLPTRLEPLLKWQLDKIESRIDELIPRTKKKTALEEAMYEDYNDADGGFGREKLQQAFESARIFRPRLLIQGRPGLGQSYLGAALLHHFEGLHVQSFDLSLLLSDSTRTPEAAVVQLFVEVKRHKPSVIYIPNVDVWYRTLAPTVVTTFVGLLRGIPPTEPILLLGYLESDPEEVDPVMVKDLFGYSKDNQYPLDTPGEPERFSFYQDIIDYIRKAPNDFPDPMQRKKRTLEILPIAPPPPPREPTREELKNQKKKDRQLLYWLKVKIQPIMDQIKLKYRKFRMGVIDIDRYPYLYPENQNPDRPPAPQDTFRPYELDTDKHGIHGLREVGSGKFFYNLNIVIIEERLSNGYYKRPKDFLFDIRTLARDSKLTDDRDRTIKANEMLANVEVDVGFLEQDPSLADCENVYLREKKREEELKKKADGAQAPGAFALPLAPSLETSATTNGHSEGATTVRDPAGFATPTRPAHSLSNGTSSGHAESNGSNHNTDVAMIDPDVGDSPVAKAQGFIAPQKPASQVQQDSTPARQSQFSQQLGVGGHVTLTPMPPGSQPEDFGNDASTTTSGKKTDQSRSSGGQHTQGSNGTYGGRYAPSFTGFGDKSKQDSQLLATQEMMSPPAVPHSSEPDSQVIHATQPPVPQFSEPNRGLDDRARIDSRLTVNEDYFKKVHQNLAEKTSGCTVEQQEQIFAMLMDRIWKERGNWNRVEVAMKVKQDFNEVIHDIQDTQGILPASYPTEDDEDDLGPSQG